MFRLRSFPVIDFLSFPSRSSLVPLCAMSFDNNCRWKIVDWQRDEKCYPKNQHWRIKNLPGSCWRRANIVWKTVDNKRRVNGILSFVKRQYKRRDSDCCHQRAESDNIFLFNYPSSSLSMKKNEKERNVLLKCQYTEFRSIRENNKIEVFIMITYTDRLRWRPQIVDYCECKFYILSRWS